MEIGPKAADIQAKLILVLKGPSNQAYESMIPSIPSSRTAYWWENKIPGIFKYLAKKQLSAFDSQRGKFYATTEIKGANLTTNTVPYFTVLAIASA